MKWFRRRQRRSEMIRDLVLLAMVEGREIEVIDDVNGLHIRCYPKGSRP